VQNVRNNPGCCSKQCTVLAVVCCSHDNNRLQALNNKNHMFYRFKIICHKIPIRFRFISDLQVLEKTKKLKYVALVHERPVPTERPPLVGEVSAKFYG
jgi:hypothetical protein